MWNGDPKPNPGAHGFLALLECSQDGVAIRFFDFSKVNQQIDQLDNGRPALSSFHLRNDLLGRK